MQTSYEYALQAVKGIKESFDNGMKNKIDEYKDNRIVDIYTTDEVFEIYSSTEGMTGTKKLSENETPPLLSLNDGYRVQIEENRFGSGIETTEKEYRRWKRDSTVKVAASLERKRNKLLTDNTYIFLTEMFTFLNGAFVTTYYAAPDAAALIGTHTWKTAGASTFSNAATAKLSLAAIDALEEYAGGFKLADGKELSLNFDHIIVKTGSENAREAKKLFAEKIAPVAVADINIYQGSKTIIETPYISYANRNYWFAHASNIENSLKIGVGEYPTLREPIKQNNEAIRQNVTGYWKQGIVNMPYDWYGSQGNS